MNGGLITITPAQFIATFPEFAAYDTTQIQNWLTEAPMEINTWRLRDDFNDARPMAIMLFTAHNLALGKYDQLTAAAGGVPGATSGPLASKSVGGVSMSYDVGATTFRDAGDFNSTGYGRRLYRLLRSYRKGFTYKTSWRSQNLWNKFF